MPNRIFLFHHADGYKYFLFNGCSVQKLVGHGRKLSKTWSPPSVYVKDEKLRESDFMHFGPPPMIISEKAHKALKNHLRYTELLPLSYGNARYHVVNVLHVVDCLDDVRTGWEAEEIEFANPVFDANRFDDADIFKIPQHPSLVFVTESFRDAVEGNGLAGLDFECVWQGC